MKEEKNIYNGITKIEEEIYPAYINLKNSKYIEIDNLYYAGLICVDYYREQTDLILKTLIETNINMNISIFYEKQDSYKTIKDLTYHIGNVGVELKESNENRQDIDIAAFTYNDAKYIRKEMQLNNEDLYFLYVYIIIYDTDLKKLEYYLNKIEGITQSKGIQTRRANFREEEVFLATLPFMENKEIIKEAARRNILTSGLLSTYPFISSTIFDSEGIFIGTNIYNNSMVFIDRYNTQKYKNANMCIFGTSGAGKMPSEEVLVAHLERAIAKEKDLKGKKVLVTAGPTIEAIDPVRYISNHSSGKMGYAIAKMAMLRGADVTLVTGQTAIEPPMFVDVVPVTSAQDMYDAVTSRSDEQDIIIKAAAVADYTPANVSDHKVKKKDGDMSIELVRTKDILKTLGENKKEGQFLCGFSMETQNMLENSRAKLEKKKIDMIAANNLKEQGAGFNTDTNVITLITKDEEKQLPKMTKEEVADAILDFIISRN